KAWAHRKFAGWNEGWGLFLNCLHFEALNDAENPLVPFFPSCGGTPEADPAGALRQFLKEPTKTFLENLRVGQWRPYAPLWSPLWIGPAALYFQRRTLPFYLVQVDAGGGLDLAADTVFPNKTFMEDMVAARIGLDSPPLLMEDIAHRRWLTASLM